MDCSPETAKGEENLKKNQMTSREITWKIRNFKTLNITKNKSLDSPPFTLDNATWCLRLYPCADEDNSLSKKKNLELKDKKKGKTCFIGLTIVRLFSTVPEHELACDFTWVGKKCLAMHGFSAHVDEDNKEHGSKKFLRRSTALVNDYQLRKTGILTLTCQVSCCVCNNLIHHPETKIFSKETKAAGASCRRFKRMDLGGEDYDVVLRVKDKELRAHRKVLWARSPVFKSMWSNDRMEKHNGVIDIPDCDPEAFKEFLHYLYSAKIKTLNTDNMLSLYYIANKYDIIHLKGVCSKFIKKSLSSSNISDVIQLAKIHGDEDLIKCATEYFVEHIKQILQIAEWHSFIQVSDIQANEFIIKAINK